MSSRRIEPLSIIYRRLVCGLFAAITTLSPFPLMACSGALWDGPQIFGIHVNPKNPQFVYVTGRDRLFRSADRGITWVSLTPSSHGLLAFAFDTDMPSTIYVSSELGFVKSIDAGNTWTQVERPRKTKSLVSHRRLTQIAVNPANSKRVVVGSGDSIFFSNDAGDSWQQAQVLAAPRLFGVTSISFDPNSRDLVYAGSYTGVLISRDGGEKWELFAENPPSPRVLGSYTPYKSIAIPNQRNEFYALGAYGLMKTSGDLNTWKILKRYCGVFSPGPFAIAHSKSSVIYAACSWMGAGHHGLCTQGAILEKSMDGGSSWTQIGERIELDIGAAIAIDPLHPNVVYASRSRGDIYQSKDSGKTWVRRRLPAS
jgi:photosystem II stability/assembly factor-like uncharacterized protein